MNLEATPEEVWAQVQKQRAQARERQASQTEALGMATVTKKAVARRVRRGWLWVLLFCTGGLGWMTLDSYLHHPPEADPSVSIVISGDNQTITSNPAGKVVEVSGDSDIVTLNGNSRFLIVNGSHNIIRVKGRIGSLVTDGNKNTVILSAGPSPVTSGWGNGNNIEQADP